MQLRRGGHLPISLVLRLSLDGCKKNTEVRHGAVSEICALGLQSRGCLWSDLDSAVVFHGANDRSAESAAHHASDVLLRIRRGDAGMATVVFCRREAAG